MAINTRIGSVLLQHHGDGTGMLEVIFDRYDDVAEIIVSSGRAQRVLTEADAAFFLALAGSVAEENLQKAENLTSLMEAARQAELEKAAAEEAARQLNAEMEAKRVELSALQASIDAANGASTPL